MEHDPEQSVVSANRREQLSVSRRRALQAAGAAILIVPRHVLGGRGQTAPSDRVTVAGIGIGGVGFPHLQEGEKAGFQIVALCDVDEVHAAKAFNRWPDARRYRSYRELLHAEDRNIDAVYIGTPDHTHAVIAVAALRRKKHLCCVKPLTRTVYEARAVAKAAREAGTATQMTASPNSTEPGCRTCELIWAGAIGAVREVHIWSNRPIWPQGMNRPPGEDLVPPTFDWDSWIGPAPMRPYLASWPEDATHQQKAFFRGSGRAVYHPFNFRGWWDFGTGALGDMGCHYINIPRRALQLGHPSSVHATSTRVTAECAPLASIVSFDFPSREDMPPVRLIWYDGDLKPPRPPELDANQPMPPEGTLYIGDEGRMLGAQILSPRRAAQFESTPESLPRRQGVWGEWLESCKGGEAASCSFDWAAPLTEIVLLGNISLRTGRFLRWDGANGRITNCEEANRFLQEPYREGWSL